MRKLLIIIGSFRIDRLRVTRRPDLPLEMVEILNLFGGHQKLW